MYRKYIPSRSIEQGGKKKINNKALLDCKTVLPKLEKNFFFRDGGIKKGKS